MKEEWKNDKYYKFCFDNCDKVKECNLDPVECVFRFTWRIMVVIGDKPTKEIVEKILRSSGTKVKNDTCDGEISKDCYNPYDKKCGECVMRWLKENPSPQSSNRTARGG